MAEVIWSSFVQRHLEVWAVNKPLEYVVPNPGPDLYFWLGAEAEGPEPTSRIVAKPAPDYYVYGLSAGPGNGYWITF